MSNDKVFAMPFARVFPLLIAKAEKRVVPAKRSMR